LAVIVEDHETLWLVLVCQGMCHFGGEDTVVAMIQWFFYELRYRFLTSAK
jgi:hypothetical protein